MEKSPLSKILQTLLLYLRNNAVRFKIENPDAAFKPLIDAIQELNEKPTAVKLDGVSMVTLKGEPGKTPVFGKDFLTKKELDKIVEGILRRATPRRGVDYLTKSELAEERQKLIGEVMKLIKVPEVKDGYTPRPGIDYPSQEQMERYVDILFSQITLPEAPKDGFTPGHEWDGTKIRFQNADGSWGDWMDLRGKTEKVKVVENRMALFGDGKRFFRELLDTPFEYAGKAGQYVRVRSTEDGLEFATVTGSGDVETDSIWDAKGDLAVGTGANTAQRLPVGSDGQVLIADSGEPSGVKWGPAGAGTVDTANSPNANEFARFTDSDTIEGRTAAEVRADLDLEIGTDVQAYSANLDEYAAVNPTAAGLALLDDADTAAQLVTLGFTATITELNYTDGVTSSIQSQLDGKVDENTPITGATKTKITYDAKGLVTSGADATQDDIGDGTNFKQYSAADKAKVGHISITQAVDLDAIEARVNSLDAAVVLRGSWDASGGTFPGSGSAQAGDSYIVSVGGTVDSVVFAANDRIVAITDNASTSTYASNWLKLDYTDQVLSVAGKTGSVTLAIADLTDAGNLAGYAAVNPTSAGLALLDDATAADQLVTLGLTATAAELNILDGATLTVTELNFVDGVTSAIQTQLDGKQPLDSDLTTLAGLTATTDNFIVSVSNAWASRTPAQVRTTLGLVIGTNVQAWDADLDTWAGKTAPSGTVLGTTDTQTLTNKTLQAGIIDYVIEPASDDTYEGESTNDLLAGDTIAQWDLVYLDATSGRWEFADADAATTSGGVLLALAAASGTDGNAMNVVFRGVVRNDGWTWSGAGKPLYVSTTPGAMTETAPSGTDDVIRVVGYTLSDDSIYFNPENDWITHT